jgi:hypothetical protein
MQNTKISQYNTLHEFNGHKAERGTDAGIEKNNYRLVEDDEGNKFYEMDMNKTNDKILFDVDDLSIIQTLSIPQKITVFNEETEEYDEELTIKTKIPTWYKDTNGYICTHGFKNSKGKRETIYLHRHLMGEKFTKDRYIDHINRNKADNRRINMQIISQSQQNNNQGLRKGKKTIMDILQPNRDKANDNNIKGLKTCFGWYDKEHLFHSLPNYLEYKKADKNFGEYFCVYSKMIKKTDDNGKTKTVSIKTTKSNELPILYKFREALLIRHNIIKDNWDFQTDGIFGIDGQQMMNLDELEKHNRNTISYFTNETESNIIFNKCKMSKKEYLVDCKKLTEGLTKNYKYVPERKWQRQERVDYLAQLFKSHTNNKLSNNGYDNLYKMVDKHYINSKDTNIEKSTKYDNNIIEQLMDEQENYRGKTEEIDINKIKKRNRQKYDQSKYYKKKESNPNEEVNDIINNIYFNDTESDGEYEVIRICKIKSPRASNIKKEKHKKINDNPLDNIINREKHKPLNNHLNKKVSCDYCNKKMSKDSLKRHINENCTKNPMLKNKIEEKQNNYNEISHKAKIARTNYFKMRTYDDDDIRDIQQIFDDGLMNKISLAQKYKIDRNVITKMVNKEINPFDCMSELEIDEYFETNVLNKKLKKAKTTNNSEDTKKDAHAKNTSIGKRKTDFDTLIQILLQKGKINYKKMSTIYKNKDGTPVNEHMCRAMCSGRTKLFEEEFDDNDEMDYETYQNIITTKAPNKKL